ncbi:MAG: hypothetical protein ACOZIN_22375 [Myxococcota bacterium]
MQRSSLTLLFLLAPGCQPNIFHAEVKGEATVAGAPGGAELNAFPTVASFSNVDLDTHQDFRGQGVTKDLVRSVKAEEVRMKILSPPEQDVSFLDTLELYARAADQETLVAQKSGIAELGLSAPNPTLALEPTRAELRAFAAAPSMSFIVRGRGRQPPKDTRVEMLVDLTVELGAF